MVFPSCCHFAGDADDVVGEDDIFTCVGVPINAEIGMFSFTARRSSLASGL